MYSQLHCFLLFFSAGGSTVLKAVGSQVEAARKWYSLLYNFFALLYVHNSYYCCYYYYYYCFICNKWWGTGVVICLERGADLHMAQLMPLPLTVSCSNKIQIGFTFLVPAHPGSPGKGPLNVCVCREREIDAKAHLWHVRHICNCIGHICYTERHFGNRSRHTGN